MSLVVSHIIQLLHHNNCVILPDFGAFLTKSYSAEINQEEHIIYPPKTTIQFNAQIKNHDGLLINSIAKGEHISFQKAEHLVNYFISDLKHSLNLGEKITLTGLGQFFKEEGIVFSVDTSANFSLEAYGLECYSTTALQKTQANNSIPEVEPKTLLLNDYDEPKHKNLKYIAASAILVGCLSIFSYNYFENRAQVLKDTNLSNEEKAEKIIENNIQSAAFSLDYNLEPVVVQASSTVDKTKAGNDKSFHIIAGAFKNKSNALALLKRLKKEGYDSENIGKNSYGLHQITYGSFNNQILARTFMSKIRRQVNKSAWLLVK